MAKIVNFIYSMIIFLSLFLVETNAQCIYPACFKDHMCRQLKCSPGRTPKCVNYQCRCSPQALGSYHLLT
ncbi:Nodule Cysteine-Rich (NCR) secreted peptide [Medicago truncatula]|uniref:Nodule Cysteine-Rich (NCR) secreted peptide n=1 Tax=Medicago truncatula TaxID=3880 RepID=A0A072TNG5_MEDTR|nr:Nodule Cysteine-Rich (NCR) secreted peptide [Medicago truncatula]